MVPEDIPGHGAPNVRAMASYYVDPCADLDISGSGDYHARRHRSPICPGEQWRRMLMIAAAGGPANEVAKGILGQPPTELYEGAIVQLKQNREVAGKHLSEGSEVTVVGIFPDKETLAVWAPPPYDVTFVASAASITPSDHRPVFTEVRRYGEWDVGIGRHPVWNGKWLWWASGPGADQPLVIGGIGENLQNAAAVALSELKRRGAFHLGGSIDDVPDPEVGQVWRSPKPRVAPRRILALEKWKFRVVVVVEGQGAISLGVFKKWARKAQARPDGSDDQNLHERL